MYNAERMAALKRAYAEMILNTTKEAAARVVVSERKALGYQQDLKVAKDEALRMCLRLKHMLDLKTTEAETISFRQQRRIDELEAQLEEAEGIIVDLREELKQVYDVLEKVKSCQSHHLNGKSIENDASLTKSSPNGGDGIVDSETILSYPSGSEIETVTNLDMNKHNNDTYQDCLKSNTGGQTEQVDPSSLEANYVKESDLAPILTRSKEPELCKNGFTQRIWAFERNLMNGTLNVSKDVDRQYSNGKNKFNVIVNGYASSKSKGMNMKKQRATEELMKFLKVHRQRRKSRLLKRKTLTGKSLYHQLMRPCNKSNLFSTALIYLTNGNMRSEKDDNDRSAHNMDESSNRKDPVGMTGSFVPKRECYNDDGSFVYNGNMEQKLRGGMGTFTSFGSSLIKSCKSHSANADSKCGGDMSSMCGSNLRVNPIAVADSGVTSIKSHCDSGSTDATESVELLDKSGAICCAEGKEEELRLVKNDDDDAKSSADSKFDLGPNMVNDSDEKLSFCQAEKNRFLRYTRRKRKIESTSISDKTMDPEKDNVKRRAEEKDSEAPKGSKDKLSYGSSRGQRRLAPVAHQIICSSGKR